jgi:leucyl aminopeptidase
MPTKIKKIKSLPDNTSVVVLIHDPQKLEDELVSSAEISYIQNRYRDHEISDFTFDRLAFTVFVKIVKDKNDTSKTLELFRKAGDEIQTNLNKQKADIVIVKGYDVTAECLLAFAEGCALGNYQFIRYFKDMEKKSNSLKEIHLHAENLNEDKVSSLNILIQAVTYARHLVNEPVIHLNAVRLAQSFETMAAETGIKIEVFNRKKIETLKMGGLLAVNKGSIDPPTFSVMEWKPDGHKNKKPIVLVGKGVVYDTGGFNLKTGSYMENMKTDMAGAATMASVVYAAARAKLPLHLIALIPATDNRVNGNAFVSGDVITMYDGTTVEVINTDAEGRLILADALSYAQKYDPELVIDAATLTGSAQRAIGKYGIVTMQSKADEYMEALRKSGDLTYERIAEFPLWDEYGEQLKSEIADLKNMGSAEAGMITAGKFLEKFTNYPFIHLDIAGVAFAEKRDSYRGMGGTGTGVRLLFEFLRTRVS